MRARRTHTTNGTVAYPGDPSRDLPVRYDTIDDHPVMVSTWALRPEERAAIATGKGNVELAVWGDSHPPVSVAVTRERILPINPEEKIPTGNTLWLELDRDHVLDLLALKANGDARPRAGSSERLDALETALLEYLPTLGEEPADAS